MGFKSVKMAVKDPANGEIRVNRPPHNPVRPTPVIIAGYPLSNARFPFRLKNQQSDAHFLETFVIKARILLRMRYELSLHENVRPGLVQLLEEFHTAFLYQLQEVCLRFDRYFIPENLEHIAELNRLILLSIRWSHFPPNRMWPKIRVLFGLKEFRIQFLQYVVDTYGTVTPESKGAPLFCTAEVVLALFEHEDVRAQLLTLPSEILSKIIGLRDLTEKLFNTMPTLISELPQDCLRDVILRNQIRTKRILLNMIENQPKELIALLNVSSDIADFCVSQHLFLFMTQSQMESLSSYLCHHYLEDNLNSVEGSRFNTVLIPQILSYFPLWRDKPGYSQLIQILHKIKGVSIPIEATIYPQDEAIKLIEACSLDYTLKPDEDSANRALQVLLLHAQPANPDALTRHKASFYVAKIYTEQKKFELAQPYLDSLASAAESLLDDEHLYVITSQLDAHSKKGLHFDETPHLAHMAPETAADLANIANRQREIFNEHHQIFSEKGSPIDENPQLGHDKPEVAATLEPSSRNQKKFFFDWSHQKVNKFQIKPFIHMLSTFNESLGSYLPEHNPSGFLYFFGFKNTVLTIKENELVTETRRLISQFLTELNSVHGLTDFDRIVDNILDLLCYSKQLNESLHQQYGRAIDGPGELGGYFSKGIETLRDSVMAVRRDAFYARSNLLSALRPI